MKVIEKYQTLNLMSDNQIIAYYMAAVSMNSYSGISKQKTEELARLYLKRVRSENATSKLKEKK